MIATVLYLSFTIPASVLIQIIYLVYSKEIFRNIHNVNRYMDDIKEALIAKNVI